MILPTLWFLIVYRESTPLLPLQPFSDKLLLKINFYLGLKGIGSIYKKGTMPFIEQIRADGNIAKNDDRT